MITKTGRKSIFYYAGYIPGIQGLPAMQRPVFCFMIILNYIAGI